MRKSGSTNFTGAEHNHADDESEQGTRLARRDAWRPQEEHTEQQSGRKKLAMASASCTTLCDSRAATIPTTICTRPNSTGRQAAGVQQVARRSVAAPVREIEVVDQGEADEFRELASVDMAAARTAESSKPTRPTFRASR